MARKLLWEKVRIENRVHKNGTETCSPSDQQMKVDPKLKKFCQEQVKIQQHKKKGKKEKFWTKERKKEMHEIRTTLFLDRRRKIIASLPRDVRKGLKSNPEIRHSINKLAGQHANEELKKQSQELKQKFRQKSSQESVRDRVRTERERISAIKEARQNFVPTVTIIERR
jgi:hypothetical protein